MELNEWRIRDEVVNESATQYPNTNETRAQQHNSPNEINLNRNQLNESIRLIR